MKTWYELTYEEKLKERLHIATYAPHDIEHQAILTEIFRRNPIFFIEAMLWTKNPQKTPSNLPFILYPFQKDLINWYETLLKEQKSGLVEKSRQMGVTYSTMAWLLHHWLFDKDFVALIGSRKEELVDKEGVDTTLFWKLDYNLNRLPKWILPPHFNKIKDRRHLLLINRKRGNILFGESANKDFGRGSTLSVCFLDEFAAWPESAASWTAVSESTNVKIAVSTPRPACFFKTLRFSKQIQTKTLHWRLHPERNDEWYAEKQASMSKEALAQEVDLSYDVSGRGKVYEEFDLVPIGKYGYNPKLPLYVSMDYGYKDSTALIWGQKDLDKKLFYIIDTYQNSQRIVDFYIPFFIGIIPPNSKYKNDYTKEEKEQIRQHKEWKRARYFGDPAGLQKTMATDISVIQQLNKAGIHVFTNNRANSFTARREATVRLIRQLCIDEHNTHFIECIRQSRYPQRREGSQATSAINKPIHDYTANYRSALEYMAVNLNLEGLPPRQINYLKKDKDIKDKDRNKKGLSIEQRDLEKKKGIIRWSFRSYQ